MARLDRLGPAKEVAQTGAVIGREFSHPVLAAVVRKREAELRSALDAGQKGDQDSNPGIAEIKVAAIVPKTDAALMK